MVEGPLAPKWSPLGVVQRLRNVVRRPADLWLAVRIGYFVCTLPTELDRSNLPGLLDRVRSLPRPRAADVQTGVERIARLRQPWLHLPVLQNRNTCYLRALALYRFLDAGDQQMCIHFGIEPAAGPDGRPRGHAWATVNGQPLEAPDAVVAGRVREIYRHSGAQ